MFVYMCIYITVLKTILSLMPVTSYPKAIGGVCARVQSLVPLEIPISQHADAKQISHPPKQSQ